jgi:hypothetical protein
LPSEQDGMDTDFTSYEALRSVSLARRKMHWQPLF